MTAATHLSDRRLAVLRGVACGYPDKVIAEALGIGERTVRAHVSACLVTLGGRSRSHLAALALAEHLVAADLVGQAEVTDTTVVRELLLSAPRSRSTEAVTPLGDAILDAVDLGLAEDDPLSPKVGSTAR